MKKNQEMLWKDQGIKIHPKIKITGQVYITDYKYLKNTEGNRPFTTGLKQIQDSINEFGVCSTPLAVKKGNKYIIVDGWHRKHVLEKRLGLPVILTLVNPDCSINELMVILNTTQINWSPEAYLNNGITYHKNPDYTFLQEVMEDTSISVSVLYEIYAHDLPKNEAKYKFQRGLWNASTKDIGDRIVKATEDISQWVPFSRNVNFMKGFAKCASNDDFDIEQMVSQLKRFPKRVHDCDKPNQHAQMINEIYNRLLPKEQKLYLI